MLSAARQARRTNHRSIPALTMKAVPPAATNCDRSSGRPTARAATPAFMLTNCAHTHRAGGEPVAVSALAKFYIAPAIATEAAPASVRCSGSHSPRPSSTGNKSDSPGRY